MGFVPSGLNLGALVAPFLAGAILDGAGFYAVWTVCLVVVAFDFILQLIMVEKKTAKKWIVNEMNNSDPGRIEGETNPQRSLAQATSAVPVVPEVHSESKRTTRRTKALRSSNSHPSPGNPGSAGTSWP